MDDIEREAIRAESLDPSTPPRWQHLWLLAPDLGALIRLVAVGGGRRYAHRTVVSTG